MSKFFTLTSLALATSITSLYGYANECKGELYGMNSGRGETGILFQIQDQLNDASADSVSKFSSAAVAYDSNQDRIYYVSSPRQTQYKLDISHLNLSSEEKKSLPIYGSRFKFTKLAYYDFETQPHVEVGRTKGVHTLVFDAANNRLIGSSSSAIYEINPQTGEYNELAKFDSLSGKYHGDLTFFKNELILVTSTSVYKVNTSDFSIEMLSKHGLKAVTGSTVDHDGNLIISRTKISDQGYLNKSQLFKLNPYSGNTCFISELPMRLNDLTTNTKQSTACYSTPICDTDPMPSIAVTAVTDEVMEGNSLEYTITLSQSYFEDVQVEISAIAGSATPSDYNFNTQTVTFPAGQIEATIYIPTINNSDHSADKTFSVQANAMLNSTGSVSVPATIMNDDPACTPVPYTKINYQFISESAGYNNDWGIKVNNQFIKLLDEYGGSGSYQVPTSTSFDYALAINGNPNQTTGNFRWNGQTQYWEDQNDADYNDFVVRAWTQQIQVGCN